MSHGSRSAAFALVVLGACSLIGCDRAKRGDAAATNSTRFTWSGPNKVFLAGEFNNWSPTATPMRRDGADRWIADVALPPGKYQYKFVVDGHWLQDSSNPESAPDGWDGLNSVVTVGTAAGPLLSATQAAGEVSAPPWPRTETRWEKIDYPDIPIPDVPGHTMTGRLLPGKEGNGRPGEVVFQLIFYQRTGEEIPAALIKPETFILRLHLGDGTIAEGKSAFGESWEGAGNQMGMTRSRIYDMPCGRNSYDEAWIEWRLPNQTFWFEVPYGLTRDPSQPWPSADPTRSEPHQAAAMNNLSTRDQLIPWRLVEYDLGEIQNHWRLTAHITNASRPAAEIILIDPNADRPAGETTSQARQPLVEQTKRWTSETPRIELQLKGQSQSVRIGFWRQDVFRRNDSFPVIYGGSDDGRDAGTAIVRVDDRSYEFTLPSSLFKKSHGHVDNDNPHRLKVAPDLVELLLKSTTF